MFAAAVNFHSLQSLPPGSLCSNSESSAQQRERGAGRGGSFRVQGFSASSPLFCLDSSPEHMTHPNPNPDPNPPSQRAVLQSRLSAVVLFTSHQCLFFCEIPLLRVCALGMNICVYCRSTHVTCVSPQLHLPLHRFMSRRAICELFTLVCLLHPEFCQNWILLVCLYTDNFHHVHTVQDCTGPTRSCSKTVLEFD